MEIDDNDIPRFSPEEDLKFRLSRPPQWFEDWFRDWLPKSQKMIDEAIRRELKDRR